MKALKIITVGILLSEFAMAQVKDTVYIDTSNSAPRYVAVPAPPPPPPQPAPIQEDPEPVFKSGEFGIRYMPSYSRFDVRSSDGTVHNADIVIGHGFGALLAINSKHVGLQLEGIYNAMAQKYKDHELDRRVNLHYINIPLLLTLNTNKSKPVNLSLAVGPQLGINIGAKVETTGTSTNGNGKDTINGVLAVKQSDFGIAYGVGLEFALNPARTFRLNLGFRGVFGLVDIDDKSATKVTNEYYILDRTNLDSYAAYIGLSVLF